MERSIEKGIAPKSQVAIVFSGPFVYDDAHLLALRAMTMVLQGRLFDTIRQELGGTYSITADQRTQKVPRPEYTIRIEWTCDPARTTALVQRVFDEIRFVKDDVAVTPEQVDADPGRAVARFRAGQPEQWLPAQSDRAPLCRWRRGAHRGTVVDLPDQIAALTGEAIQQAARTYLDTENYVKVTLMPEAK